MASQNNELRQELRQRMRLTQQQLQYVKLLELNAPEFKEAVERELEANPALEADKEETEHSLDDNTPYYLRSVSNGHAEDTDYDYSAPAEQDSLYEHLTRQLGQFDLKNHVRAAAEYIIGNLDTNGYLLRPLHNIINDMAFSAGIEISDADARKALETVRSLDPAGVGAENLRDCLLLQLKALPESRTRDDAEQILTHCFTAFSMRHTHKIISALRLSEERIQKANTLIVSLNPKPGAAYGGSRSTIAGIISPDFTVSNFDGELSVAVNNGMPQLHIEQSFSEAMHALRDRANSKKSREFVVDRYNQANDFIEIVRRRQETLLAVMTAIVSLQKEYFETGDVYALRPMMMKDIKRLTGMDFSAISRSTNNKYVETPWGSVMPLRNFFSDSKGDEDNGGVLTNRQIEAQIAAIVAAEDKRHPLSDEKIRLEMLKRGFDLSRRTIAKYRDRQKIPAARLRKSISL